MVSPSPAHSRRVGTALEFRKFANWHRLVVDSKVSAPLPGVQVVAVGKIVYAGWAPPNSVGDLEQPT